MKTNKTKLTFRRGNEAYWFADGGWELILIQSSWWKGTKRHWIVRHNNAEISTATRLQDARAIANRRANEAQA